LRAIDTCRAERDRAGSAARHDDGRRDRLLHGAAVCAKLLVNAGAKRVVYEGDYPDELAVAILREAGIALDRFGEGDAER